MLDRRNPQQGATTTDPRLTAEAHGLRFVIELQLAGPHTDLFVGADEVVVYSPDGS